MSKTPRTDEQVALVKRTIQLIGLAPDGGLGDIDVVTGDFARELECELADMNRLREEQQYLAITRGEALEKVRKDLLALEKRLGSAASQNCVCLARPCYWPTCGLASSSENGNT